MSTSHTPKAGDEAYLEDGSKVEVLAVAPSGGYLVCAVYEPDDYEPGYGSPMHVAKVWRMPPVEVWEKRVGEARDQLTKLVEEADSKRKAITQHQSDERRIRDNLRKHGVLEQIEAALEDRLTHAVTISNTNVRLCTLAEALKDPDSSYRLRQLVLSADLKGGQARLRWTSDNPFRHDNFEVFTSEEAARAHAISAVEKLVAAHRVTMKSGGWLGGTDDLVKSHAHLGMAVPNDIIEHKRIADQKVLQAALAKAEAEAAVYRARLSEVSKASPSPVKTSMDGEG